MIKLTPVQKRQLRAFRKNRRGYWSMWIFCILFIAACGAEWIANNKPLLVTYKDQWYFPLWNEYSETEFGGDFDTEADYRDPYFIDHIKSGEGYMLWPFVRYDYRTINYDLPSPAPSPPTSENLLGTDDQGRDVFARILYGFRISVIFGLLLTFFSSIIGITVGACQGYYGGKFDLLGQRFIEIWSSMPTLFIMIILSSFVEPTLWWLLGIMLLFSWMQLVDVVRAEFLRCRNFEYVRAAHALGVADMRIIVRHILPNAMVTTFTYLPFVLSGSIVTLTSLDFLGFGLPIGSPSLGELLAQGKSNLHAPWLGLSAFITLSVLLCLLTFIGEATRDAFDPRWSNV
ncbi:MAG: ABC transporter permease [Pseudomonadota bacterium]